MRSKIKNFVALYFSSIPYSEEAAAAQDKITSALNNEFESVCGETSSEDRAFEIIVGKYATLSDMAALAGYGKADAQEWRLIGRAMKPEETRKSFFVQRRLAYFIAFALTCIAVNLFEGAFLHWANILSALIWGAAAFWGLRSYHKHYQASQGLKYNKDAYRLLCELSDIYTKRTLNGIFI